MASSAKDAVLSLLQNIIKCCEEEKAAGSYSFPVEQVINRVVAMTGKSKNTILRIRKTLFSNEAPQPSSRTAITKKSTSRQKSSNTDLDDADRCVLRNKINSLYTVTKTVPTLNILHAYMTQETSFSGCKETLRKIIIGMGYRYKKCQSNRYSLMERQDIVAWRARYLRFIIENDQLGINKRPIVYLDESYVHKNYTVGKCWQSDEVKGVLKKDGAGQRWIMAHAGGTMGFIDGCLLLFKSKTKSGDYHDEMNFENFSKWFMTVLIPKLPKNSIIVMDNAPYHSVQDNKAPTASSKKSEIVSWLQSKNLPYHPSMLKCELLQIVKQNKPLPEYKIDNCAIAHGHTVLRLPPYHCDLNPIELIWSMVKRKVAAHNIDASTNMEYLIRQSFEEITPDLWQGECEHVKRIEKQYIEHDRLNDEVNEFIIRLSESDSEMEWTDSESEL